MNRDKYIPILCRNATEREEIIQLLNNAGIETSRVGKTEDRVLAYFSEESQIMFIKKILKKYALIDSEPFFLSPKQKSMMR